VSDRNRWAVLGRVGLVTGAIALAGGMLPTIAGAAPPTPASLTNCGGTISPDPTGKASGEPNLLDYRIQCDGDISAYTIILDQQGDPGGSIDDYNPAPSVLEAPLGVTPSPSESLTCEGTTPSDGINCNAGAGAVMSAGLFGEGSIDPIQAYCKHFPTGATPGTAAVPTALVQLVVTDATGAQDGPFTLRRTTACPKVANVVPTPKAKKKTKTKGKSKKS